MRDPRDIARDKLAKNRSGTSRARGLKDRVLPSRGGPSLRQRARRFILGDPRQAPSRVLRGLTLLFIVLVVAAAAVVLGQETESAGSQGSYWLFNTLTWLVENPISIIGASLFLYFRLFGLRRSWAAKQAADTTGWLVDTVQQLSDEVRSMKGSSFLILSSDDTRSDIEEAVSDGLDSSLTGASHDRERPDFYETLDDVVDVDDEQWMDSNSIQEAATNANNLALTLALKTDYLPDESAAIARHNGGESVRAGIGSEVDTDPLHDSTQREGGESADDRDDDAVPWGTAVKEELHSLWLSLSTSLNKGRIYWELGFPYIVAAWLQLIAAGFWVQPAMYVLILGGTSPLFALGVFWLRQRIQDRRVSRHRTPTTGSFWADTGARVKVVQTPDVTAYVGQTAGGRTYASYDREEFVSEFSLRLWQMTTEGEEITPSLLEQYARNLKQMKPNLRGHLQNTELVSIRGDIAQTVNSAQDEVVTKAQLAFSVIEPTGGRFSNDLGHDPKLVAEVYRQKVEDIHSLSEMETTRETPDGTESTLTLVYPTPKTRLPDMTELHSRFSERFMGVAGEPIHEMPEVNPREDLEGHTVPYETQTAIQSAGELPAVGAD